AHRGRPALNKRRAYRARRRTRCGARRTSSDVASWRRGGVRDAPTHGGGRGMSETVPIVTVSAAVTSVGRRRDHNEDAYLEAAPLFLVADGMGGYEGGEVASAAAIGAFGRRVGSVGLIISEVREANKTAGENVMVYGSGGRPTAGTTLSGVAVSENEGAKYWLLVN